MSASIEGKQTAYHSNIQPCLLANTTNARVTRDANSKACGQSGQSYADPSAEADHRRVEGHELFNCCREQ